MRVCYRPRVTRHGFATSGPAVVVTFRADMNKARRKAFRHFLKGLGLRWVGCEFNRDCPAGVRPEKLRADTLATAWLVMGPVRCLRRVEAHGFVARCQLACGASHRMTAKLGPPKRPVRPGPKNVRRKGTRAVIQSSEIVWKENDEGRLRPVGTATSWTLEAAK